MPNCGTRDPAFESHCTITVTTCYYLYILIKFHQNNQKVIYFCRFDLYQRPSSEEAGTGSFSGSWRDKLESSQEPEEDLVPASSDEGL